MKKIFSWLFDYPNSINLKVSYPSDEAIERLRRATTPYPTALLASDSTKPSLVGFVSKDQVRLHKVTFMYANIFKPIFVGKFVTRDNEILLVGDFKMGSVARVTTYIFVGFLSFIQLILLVLIISDPDNRSQFFDPLSFIALGVLVVYSAKLIGKKDIPWIENKIKQALL